MTGETSSLENLDELYEAIILDHYRNPRNTDPVDNPDIDVEATNPFCGDEVRIQISLEDESVSAISVRGRGCAISQSSGSLLAELIEGKDRHEAVAIIGQVRRLMKGDELSESELDALGDLDALSGVRKFPVRIKCALLSWAALEDALEELEDKLAARR